MLDKCLNVVRQNQIIAPTICNGNVFIAGSRMAREMKYTADALGMDDGEINEAVIQVSEDEGQNVLTVESLLLHLDVLKEVVSVNMHMLDM